jgi:hypothetical protein
MFLGVWARSVIPYDYAKLGVVPTRTVHEPAAPCTASALSRNSSVERSLETSEPSVSSGVGHSRKPRIALACTGVTGRKSRLASLV